MRLLPGIQTKLFTIFLILTSDSCFPRATPSRAQRPPSSGHRAPLAPSGDSGPGPSLPWNWAVGTQAAPFSKCFSHHQCWTLLGYWVGRSVMAP